MVPSGPRVRGGARAGGVRCHGRERRRIGRLKGRSGSGDGRRKKREGRVKGSGGGGGGGGGGGEEAIGVLVECAGCVVDAGALSVAAFNGALERHEHSERGARWTVDTYCDLLPRAAMMGGTAEAMFRTWFGHVGYPKSLPPGADTRDRFVRELTVLKDACEMELLEKREFALVNGFSSFACDAVKGGATLSVVLDRRIAWQSDAAASFDEEASSSSAPSNDERFDMYVNAVKNKVKSECGDEVFNSIVFSEPDSEKLNMEVSEKQSGDDAGVGDVDAMMAELVRKHKQQVAQQAAQSLSDVLVMLPSSVSQGASSGLTPSLVASICVLDLGLSPASCGFLASHASTARAAAGSSCAMVYGVRGSTTRGADWRSGGASPKVRTAAGFGGGDGVTWRRLSAAIEKERNQRNARSTEML